MSAQQPAEGQDWRPMGEDVSTHTMGRMFGHDDGRLCCFHHRLGAWVFGMFPTTECLRDHPTPAADR